MVGALSDHFFAELGNFLRMSTIDSSLVELCQRCGCGAEEDVRVKVNPQESVVTFYSGRVSKRMNPGLKHGTGC